ncbi:MAG: mycothione reductase [Acidimicrobiales bacterium]
MADYDLVILGAGSGNVVPDETLGDWKIAIVESDRFGGTCLNRGCIPSKMLVYTADVAETVRRAGRFGINAELAGVDWPAIRDRIFDRIDPLHESALSYRRGQGIDVFQGEARFVGPKVLDVAGERVHGERFVISAGSRPVIPELPGLESVSYHTSDTIMRLDDLPSSLVIIGGGYIAAEMGHVFGALGVRVTIVGRGPALLESQDHDISARFTQTYEERFDLRLAATIEAVSPTGSGVAVDLTVGGRSERVEADVMLLAVGRTPNTDRIDAAAGGLDVDDHGHLVTDASYATAVPGVWALGDVTNHFQLKHMANAEARMVRYNLIHADQPIQTPFRLVPAAVFADPQVAAVGATERQLRAEGRPHLVASSNYSAAAYGWALEDTSSFVKVLADPATRLLLGAHIIGPQASTLIQPLLQGMCLDNTVDEVATGVLYIHPALSEVVEQALLALGPP